VTARPISALLPVGLPRTTQAERLGFEHAFTVPPSWPFQLWAIGMCSLVDGDGERLRDCLRGAIGSYRRATVGSRWEREAGALIAMLWRLSREVGR
jgi:hypothetical protein